MSWGVPKGTAMMTSQIKSAKSVEDIRGHTRLMVVRVRLRRAQGVLTVNFLARAPGGPKWSRPWNGRPHTDGVVHRRIRMRNPTSDPEEDIRRTVKDPTADREVWLMLGNLLWKNELEHLLLEEAPRGHAMQTAYLLFSTITNVAAAGARLRVFGG
jgi:hypothetical protein